MAGFESAPFAGTGLHMAIEITGTGRAVPPERVTNGELARRLAERGVETNDEWIRSHTGIGARHIADAGCATSDLAVKAAEAALAMAAPGKSPAEAALALDIIIVATVTSDYCSCPSTACLVQAALGAKNAAALDISAGCTGFIYGVETAAGLLMAGVERKRALVIGADTLSRFIDWSDRGTCVLFGDGAGAVTLEKTEGAAGPGRRGLLRSFLAADGSGAEHLIFKRGGSRSPFRAGETLEGGVQLSMNGRAVYGFAVKALTDALQRLLADEGIAASDLSWIVPHQANARIVQAAAKRLDIPEAKFFLNMEEYANTSSASIPIALDELNRSGRLAPGSLVMTIGFGSGLTYGGNLFAW